MYKDCRLAACKDRIGAMVVEEANSTAVGVICRLSAYLFRIGRLSAYKRLRVKPLSPLCREHRGLPIYIRTGL